MMKTNMILNHLMAMLLLMVANNIFAQGKSESNETLLQEIKARQDITELIVSYGHSFDMKDWKLHRSLFTDEIEMDFSASIGGSGLTTFEADTWVSLVKPFFHNLNATQHIGMPLTIKIEGDTAYARSMLHAQHFLPNSKGDNVQRMIGYYDNYFIRTSDGWKINKMIQYIDWNEGNWYIFEKAAGIVDVETSIANEFIPNHVALRVKNLEISIDWYEKVFGAKVLRRSKVANIDPKIEIAFLELAHDFHIELVGGGTPKKGKLNVPVNIKEDYDVQGYKHIGFKVKNYEKVLEHLKQNNVDVYYEIDREDYGVRIALLHDINGYTIELYGEL